MAGIPIIGDLVGGGAKPKAAPPPAAVPTPGTSADALAAAAEAERRARGRASNILTGGSGLLGSPSLASTVLLGS
jgi:hypothetical protein